MFPLSFITISKRVLLAGIWLAVVAAFPHLCVAKEGCKAEKNFDDAEKKLAELEEQRRREAAEEFQRARKKLEQLESRAETMRLWTQVQFHSDLGAASPRLKADNGYLQRLQRQRAQTLDTLLQFPEKSNGAVKTGRALSFFLDECGPAAFELVYYRSLETSQARQVAADEIKHELLSGFSTNYPIDQKIIRHVSILRGETGRKLTGRLNAVPLDLERICSVLRKDEFLPQIEGIRARRDDALNELENGKPVSAATADRLMTAVDSLLTDIRIAKREKSKVSFDEFRPYLQAERHMLAIFSGASRLIEAYEADDVLLDEFKGGNIEELLAYMHRNNLHFGPADDNAEGAYRILFGLLAKYYCDLRTLQQAAVDTQQEIAQGKRRERELEDIKLGVSLNNMQKYDLWAKGIGAVTTAFEAFGKEQDARRREAERDVLRP